MIVSNLPRTLVNQSGLTVDNRFKHWAKFVDSVDPSGTDGFAFKGEFIKSGTIELNLDGPRVVLCAAETGSRKSRSYDFAVVVLNPDGTVEGTAIATNGERGWALRIRDAIIALLEILNKTITVEPLTVALDQHSENLLIELADSLQLSHSDVIHHALSSMKASIDANAGQLVAGEVK